MVDFKGKTYSAAHIKIMREWVSECAGSWVEDEEEIEEMSDMQIVRGVQRHFDGGLDAFMVASFPDCPNCGEAGCECYKNDEG